MYAGNISSVRKIERRRGVAAAELALLAPTLVFILVAGTDFSRLFYSYVTVSSCARNGALWGCQDTASSTNTSGIQTAAQSDGSSLSSLPTISSSTSTISSNPYVSVTASYTFTTLINWPGIPHTMSVSRTVKMRVVQNTPN